MCVSMGVYVCACATLVNVYASKLCVTAWRTTCCCDPRSVRCATLATRLPPLARTSERVTCARARDPMTRVRISLSQHPILGRISNAGDEIPQIFPLAKISPKRCCLRSMSFLIAPPRNVPIKQILFITDRKIRSIIRFALHKA